MSAEDCSSECRPIENGEMSSTNCPKERGSEGGKIGGVEEPLAPVGKLEGEGFEARGVGNEDGSDADIQDSSHFTICHWPPHLSP